MPACGQYWPVLTFNRQARARGGAAAHFSGAPKAMLVLEEAEIQAVAEMREQFAPMELDTFTCIRFLRANDLHVKKAAKQLRVAMAWREREAIDDVVKEAAHSGEIEAELDLVAMRLIDGKDLLGRPVMVAALGNVDMHHLKKKGITLPMMIRRHARAMEALVERLRTAQEPLGGHLLILDLAGCTLFKFFSAWAYIREIAHMGQQYYPELLGKMCFVRGPERAFWAIDKVKLLLNQETRNKIELSVGDVLPLLHANLPLQTALPAFVYCTPLEQIIGCCGPADDCVGQDRADVNGSPSERQHLRCTLMHSASLHKAPRNNRQVHPKPQRDDIITGMNCFVFCFVSPFDSTI